MNSSASPTRIERDSLSPHGIVSRTTSGHVASMSAITAACSTDDDVAEHALIVGVDRELLAQILAMSYWAFVYGRQAARCAPVLHLDRHVWRTVVETATGGS